MDMLKEIERIEALAENKRDSVKLANFWKMYALEMRDEKNAEIQKLQTDLQNWKDFCKKVQRQQLAEHPNVDVLAWMYKSSRGTDIVERKFDDETCKHLPKDCVITPLVALATYQAKNEKE